MRILNRLSSDDYSNSKIEAEGFVRRYCTQNRLPFTIVRPGFIYGEGDNNFLPKLLGNLRTGKFKYIGSAKNHLNTVYIGNVVQLVIKAIGNKGCFGQSYNLADEQQVQLQDFVEDVAKGMGYNIPTKHVPAKVALRLASILEKSYRLVGAKKAPFLTRKKITFMLRDRLIDSGKAYGILGEVPFTYEQGIKRTMGWFRIDSEIG